jgi:hypothetical protein
MDSEETQKTFLSGVAKAKSLQSSRSWPRKRTAIMLCGTALIVYWISRSSPPQDYVHLELELENDSPSSIFYDSHWAQYSPYRPVADYEQPPEACQITQASKYQTLHLLDTESVIV